MITIHNGVEQGTDEWLGLRRGLVTASSVGQLLSVGTAGAGEFACPTCGATPTYPCLSVAKNGGATTLKAFHPARTAYARDAVITTIAPARTPEAKTFTMLLVAERITGWSDPMYVSDDMWRGIEDEPRARDKYAEHYAPVTECGFMTEDCFGFAIGYSPDGLVGDDGLIEIKSRRPKAHLATILADQVPAANMAQLQCGLLVSGRQWIDYVSYCGGMPLWVKRVTPQQQWFDAIVGAVQAFEDAAAGIIATYGERVAGLPATERTLTDLEITI